MPRNVRNFWVELDVSGRKTRVETGPSTKDGRFELTVRIRDQGAISDKHLHLWGVVLSDGTLQVRSQVDWEGGRDEQEKVLLEGHR